MHQSENDRGYNQAHDLAMKASRQQALQESANAAVDVARLSFVMIVFMRVTDE